MVNSERLLETFLHLIQIDGVSRREGQVADWVEDVVRGLGCQTWRDDTGARIGGETGNLIATFPAPGDAPSVILCAHLDTIKSTKGVRWVREGNLIRTSGETILGADDRAGVAIIIEVLRALAEAKLPRPAIEAVFTVAEEMGLLGSQHLPFERLRSRLGFIADGGHEPNVVVAAGPTHERLKIAVIGRAAHAAVHPEEGISAISIASRAIAQMSLGKVDDETVANVGVIHGGEATNIVPARVEVEAEARSHSPEKLRQQVEAMTATFQRCAAEAGGQVEVRVEHLYDAYRLSEHEPVVTLIAQAMRKRGLELSLRPSAGGTDANFFNQAGIRTAVLPTGANKPHGPDECLHLDAFATSARLMFDLVLEARTLPATPS